MHWFDVGATVLAVLFGVWGLWRGLIREVMSLVGFIVAFVLAVRGYSSVAPVLHVVTADWLRQAISIVLIFVLAILLTMLLSHRLSRMLQLVGLSWPDRFLGGVFGVVKVTLIVAGLLIVSGKFLPASTRQLGVESALVPVFFQTADILASVLEQQDYHAFQQMSQQARQPLQKLIAPPQAVPAVVDTMRPQPSPTPPAPAVPLPTAPPTAAAPPAAKPRSLQLDPSPQPPPADTPPPVAQRPAEPVAPQGPGSADSPSGISDADSKALEKILRERLQERRR